MIKKIVPDAKLFIIGDGPYKKELISIAQRLHINGIYFPGAISNHELASYFQNAKLFILLSDYEAFAISLMEAMSYGCTVVATKVGIIPEVIKNGVNGFLVNSPPNREELANLITYLLQDEELVRKIGINGRQSILSNYSWEQVAFKTFSLYGSVLQK
jgi:glycosyltransferase involved in cell wall biosynthesis